MTKKKKPYRLCMMKLETNGLVVWKVVPRCSKYESLIGGLSFEHRTKQLDGLTCPYAPCMNIYQHLP